MAIQLKRFQGKITIIDSCESFEPSCKIREPGGNPRSRSEAFSLIKGTWHVTYPVGDKPGAEDVTIDGDGYYYLSNAPSLKYFKLSDAEFFPQTRQVRFTKVSASGPVAGRPHDTEILTLSPDGSVMEGLSVGYGHPIKYTRIPS